MKQLYKNLKYISNHPLNHGRVVSSWIRFFKWQIGSRLLNARVVWPWVGTTFLYVGRGDQGLTQNIYCGLHDYAEMAFLLHAVTTSDIFYDIGANAGSYSVLASGVRRAKSVCFEPIPGTFLRLESNLAINHLGGLVMAHKCAVGELAGEIRFTADKDCMNHVLAEGEYSEATVVVPVRRLDEIVKDSKSKPTCMKIDVEGYEMAVIKGGHETFSDKTLRFIIMEANGSGERYGLKDDEIFKRIIAYGFRDCFYNPLLRQLIELNGAKSPTGNVIFVRDVESMKKCVTCSKPFQLMGITI